MTDLDNAFPGSGDFYRDGMTLRQYAAIHLKVPRSGDEKLDAMIRDSRRAEFAGRIMAGMLAWEKTKVDPEGESEAAFTFADALLAGWEKGAGE